MIQNENRYTVITGASSGIGYATAKAFAELGSNLILAARRHETMETLRQEILTTKPTLDIKVISSDLSDPENAFQFYKQVSSYPLTTWINNAGFGNYDEVGSQSLNKIQSMIHLNIEALTILSSLFVRDFSGVEDTQLINISSCGGYTIVPNAVTYCATKYYVSAFTEGLAWELKNNGAKMQAKVLAPAATKTEFGKVANDVSEYDYDKLFGTYHSAEQVADYIIRLYKSDKTVGIVDRENFSFHLYDPLFKYAGNSNHNQKM